jgi:CO dehydrogenase/acetyl-CoA synthase gamma subunit (corrinoid Fe-S protein)
MFDREMRDTSRLTVDEESIQTTRSLFQQEYDEEESHRSFQEALREWRESKPVKKQSTQAIIAEVQTAKYADIAIPNIQYTGLPLTQRIVLQRLREKFKGN